MKHGHACNNQLTPTYQSWRGMKTRCLNPQSTDYTRYGGRGIRITPRWLGKHGFEHFLNDMGERPDGKTLERLNPNGHYTTRNCVWATYSEQAFSRNKRTHCIHGHKFTNKTIFIKANGSRGCLICKRAYWRTHYGANARLEGVPIIK